MSKYGRWREAEEQLFEAWWKEFLAKGWLVLHTQGDGSWSAVEPRDDNEVAMAKNAAINAWMKAKEGEAPDD